MESNSNSGNESVINELNSQVNDLKNENEKLREHDSEQAINSLSIRIFIDF